MLPWVTRTPGADLVLILQSGKSEGVTNRKAQRIAADSNL